MYVMAKVTYMYIIGDIDVYYETVTSMCIMSKDSDIGVCHGDSEIDLCYGESGIHVYNW